MKSKLHLNYWENSSLAFTAKEKTIDCKEDPWKKSKYLEKKKREMIKKRNGSLEIIGNKIALVNPMNTFLFFLPPVLSLTQRHLKKGKKKGSIELLCTLVPATIRYPYVVYNVER